MITKEQKELLQDLAKDDCHASPEEAEAIRAALDTLNAQAVPVGYAAPHQLKELAKGTPCQIQLLSGAKYHVPVFTATPAASDSHESELATLRQQLEEAKAAAPYCALIDATPENTRETMLHDALAERDQLKQQLADSQKDAGWQPIDTAPQDNARPLYLARFVDGEMQKIDFAGSWEFLGKIWTLRHTDGFGWASADGIQEPTHWAYQTDAPPMQKDQSNG